MGEEWSKQPRTEPSSAMGGLTHELAEVAGGGQLLWKTMNSGVGSTALGQFVIFCTGLCLNLLTQSCVDFCHQDLPRVASRTWKLARCVSTLSQCGDLKSWIPGKQQIIERFARRPSAPRIPWSKVLERDGKTAQFCGCQLPCMLIIGSLVHFCLGSCGLYMLIRCRIVVELSML